MPCRPVDVVQPLGNRGLLVMGGWASTRILGHAGCELKSIALCEDIATHNNDHDLIANAELYQVHEAWFEDHREVYKPMSRAMLEFGRSVSAKTLSAS